MVKTIRFQGQAKRWWNGKPVAGTSAELMGLYVSQIEDVICFIELGWPKLHIDLDIPPKHVRTYCLEFAFCLGGSTRIERARLEFDLRRNGEHGYTFLRIRPVPPVAFMHRMP